MLLVMQPIWKKEITKDILRLRNLPSSKQDYFLKT